MNPNFPTTNAERVNGPTIAYFCASDPYDDQVSALKRDGAIVVRDLVSETTVESILSELQPHFD
ncbi:MAG: hypothetical protein VW311_02160, partial [Gammaproteobacteria bacterium]